MTLAHKVAPNVVGSPGHQRGGAPVSRRDNHRKRRVAVAPLLEWAGEPVASAAVAVRDLRLILNTRTAIPDDNLVQVERIVDDNTAKECKIVLVVLHATGGTTVPRVVSGCS